MIKLLSGSEKSLEENSVLSEHSLENSRRDSKKDSQKIHKEIHKEIHKGRILKKVPID
jgi:hypothetical protein